MRPTQPNSVLIDANIWASSTLHSWFGIIASKPRQRWTFFWTEDILAEAVHARRRRFPKARSDQMEAVRERLMKIIGENQIKNFPHDDRVTYPDLLDAHVHSSAIHAGIAEVVTNNVKDFQNFHDDPNTPYEVLTADSWLMAATETAPEIIDYAILAQLRYVTEVRQQTADTLVENLNKAGCPNFALHVKARLDQICIQKQ